MDVVSEIQGEYSEINSAWVPVSNIIDLEQGLFIVFRNIIRLYILENNNNNNNSNLINKI